MFDSLTKSQDQHDASQPLASAFNWDDLALRSKVDEFLFSVETWVHPEALTRYYQAKSGKLGLGVDVDFKALSILQKRRLISAHLPSKGIAMNALTSDWRARLALLSADDWMRLGFAVSVLPFCGHVQRSMDGNFRRAVREAFGPAIWAELDSHAQASVELQFLLGAGAWKTTPLVAAGGVRSAIQQACDWAPEVRERFCLKLDPGVMEAPVSVRGLNPYWLEIACKITLQDHPWLWS